MSFSPVQRLSRRLTSSPAHFWDDPIVGHLGATVLPMPFNRVVGHPECVTYPPRIRFVIETLDITQDEIEYLQNVIKTLQNTIFLLEGKLHCVKHTIMLTKIHKLRAQWGAAVVGLLRKNLIVWTSKEILTWTQFPLDYLLCTLEFVYIWEHIAYKRTVKKWQLRSVDDKTIVVGRKKAIQKNLEVR